MFCLVIIVCTIFTTCVALYFKQWQQSLQIRWRTNVFILHAEHYDSSSFFLLKNISRQFKQNLCLHFNTLIGFPISVLLASSNFPSGGISSDFICEERKLKKLWIQVECLTSCFGLPFWAAFTLRILLPIIHFWSIWTLMKISYFSACRVQFLNADVLIVLSLLMVVNMAE